MTPSLRARFILSLVVLSLLAGCGKSVEHRSVASQKAEGAQEVPFPFPVIEMVGTGEQIGTLHGTQQRDVIRDLHDRYLKAYFRSDGQQLLAMTAAAAFEQRTRSEHLEEINALAKASGVNPRQMLLAQCFLDLSPMTACSTVALPASASPDGVARFGRNLDFPGFNVAEKLTVVQVYRPAGRNAFMAVGWPGMAGVLSGMNEHGLAVANMEVKRGMRLPTAMPYILLYRTVLEQCRTTQEAIDLIEKTPRQTANNLMVMDAAGDRAVIEITPTSAHVRRAPADAALVSTNHQRGDDVDTAGRCRRFDSIIKRSGERRGNVDVRAIESMLAEASQGKKTLQSMVFEPSNRVMYLAAGPNAAKGTFYRLDLKKYFGADAGAALH